MAAITTKVDICNLAIGGLGNRNTITNIDTPKNDKEIVMALWYDITRQLLLKTLMPNFALDRVIVSAKAVPAGYSGSYAYCFEYPVYCLKLLGIGDIDQKGDISYAVEGNSIFVNEEFPNGMPIRIVRDITDVPSMSTEFVITLASELGKRTALPITQDPQKKAGAIKDAQLETANATGLNAQENPPIRKSTSRFRQSRYYNVPQNPVKR